MPATAPLRNGYRVHSMEIEKLKNLSNLDEISFEDKPLTGIFGPNCCGKSTILHALACCYQPPANSLQFNYKFSFFFVPNTDALWQGSKLVLTHSYRYQTTDAAGNTQVVDLKRRTSDYLKRTTRWIPRYDKRPARPIAYIGVSSCVPHIELEKREYMINYTTATRNDNLGKQVLSALGRVLNRSYDELNEHTAGSKKYGGLKSTNIRYSTLSMGAGEQRLLYVLEALYSIPKKGLILIDELDIMLHGDALERFVKAIHDRAKDKELQIVFTSHREQLLDLDEFINIRHLHNVDGDSVCLNDTKPDALRRLTGQQTRPLEILVEDDLATAIVNKVASSLGMKKYVETYRFGAAKNAFTVVGGMVLKGDNVDSSLCLLDGDEYRTDQLKDEQIKKVLTGNQQEDDDRRTKSVEIMTDLALPEGQHPEQYIHGMIVDLDVAGLNDEDKELVTLAKEIQMPQDRHDYVNKLVEEQGYGRREGLLKVIDLASESNRWDEFVKPVQDWLEAKKPEVVENAEAEAPAADEQEGQS